MQISLPNRDGENKQSQVWRWFKKVHLARNITYLLIALSIFFAVTTYTTITEQSDSLGPDPQNVIRLIMIDLVLILTLTLIISRRIFRAWVKRKGEFSTSRLQNKIVFLFSLVAAVPTVIVTVFSVSFFNYGIQSWFNDRISTALDGSVAVAESYFKEHTETIRNDIVAMSSDITRQYLLNDQDQKFLQTLVGTESIMRNLSEAAVFTKERVLASYNLGLEFDPSLIPVQALERAEGNQVIIMNNEKKNMVRGLVRIQEASGLYLIVGREVETHVLSHIDQTKGAVKEYARLKSEISSLQVKFVIVFFLVSLLLVVAAILAGVMFASEIASPIKKLVGATEKLKAGNYDIQVEENIKDNEINILAKAFNSMTSKIKEQRNELIDSSAMIDNKRQFTETVLACVSAGVIAINKSMKITLLNKSALKILGIKEGDQEGILDKKLELILPEFLTLVMKAKELDRSNREVQNYVEEELHLVRNNRKYILKVRIVPEVLKANKVNSEGFVITFDDITDLLQAQKSAAWSDVARRVAHEIKNPLTPIKLATERLVDKFSREVSDKDTYLRYLKTIEKQVSDIGSMVDEFSNFAKLQAPVTKVQDVVKILKESIFLEQVVGKKIKYEIEASPGQISFAFDERLISQMTINLLKNARESIEAKREELGARKKFSGNIKVIVVQKENCCTIQICDNGKGFDQDVESLIKPYVTTRPKGTGLGLSIVNKIVEEHGGLLKLANSETGGAVVTISFPFK